MNHAEVESEAEISDDDSVLSRTIEFLDYFDVSMDVVVGCARKIEVTRWPRLFDVVGSPKSLFEVCIVCSPVILLLTMPPIDLSCYGSSQDGSFVSPCLTYIGTVR